MLRSLLYIGIGIILIGAALIYSTRNVETPQIVPSSSTITITPLPPVEDLVAQITPNPDRDDTVYPIHVAIDDVDLNAVVTIVGLNEERYVSLPEDTAGFWDQSALLNNGGNTVLVGHNRTDPNVVFRPLQAVEQGDRVTVTGSDGSEFDFVVESAEIIQVADAPAAEANRVNRAMTEETTTARLTLISCYPDDACTHRVVILAAPVAQP